MTDMTATRRGALGIAGGAIAAVMSPRIAWASSTPIIRPSFRQGLTRMVLGENVPVEECCRIASQLGLTGLDFFSDPKDWPILKRYGLACSLYRADYGGGLSGYRAPAGPPGWHAIGIKAAQGAYLEEIRRSIDLAADNGIKNVLLLAGTRDTVSYAEGMDNAAEFLGAVAGQAEARGVTLCIEMLNSKGIGGPPLSLFDHMDWGVDLCKRVASSHVKIVYDFFHAQMMDGNLATTLRKQIEWIGHIHVGGVPGRHELDGNQEINYPFLGRVLNELNYQGFVTHEWTPSTGTDPIEALKLSIAALEGR